MKPLFRPERFEVAPRFIKAHYQPEDRLVVALIERSSGQMKQELRTAAQIAGDPFMSYLRASNASGKDVYISTNTVRTEATGRTKGDVDQIRHLYLDLDSNGKAALDKVLASPDVPKPHTVMESSPGKYQALWKVAGFDQEQAEHTVRGMAKEFGADAAVFDSARILRVPGFRNWKYPDIQHYVKEIPGDRSDRVYTPADFPRYQERDLPAPQFGSRSTERHLGQSDQSEKDFAYAMRHLERNMSPEVVTRNIAEYRRLGNATGSMNYKHDPDRYAETTVRKAQAQMVSRPIAVSRMSTDTERSR